MEKYLELNKEVVEDLNEIFKDFEFHSHINNIGVNICVFLVLGMAEDFDNEQTWKKISEEIAIKYQSQISSIEDKWNIYIIYIIKDKAQKTLKAEIENDKFASRKIVLNSFQENLDDKTIKEIIANNIIHLDLAEIIKMTESRPESEYVPLNSYVWDLIPCDISISGNKQKQESILTKLNTVGNENK